MVGRDCVSGEPPAEMFNGRRDRGRHACALRSEVLTRERAERQRSGHRSRDRPALWSRKRRSRPRTVRSMLGGWACVVSAVLSADVLRFEIGWQEVGSPFSSVQCV